MKRLPDSFDFKPIGWPRWNVFHVSASGKPTGALVAVVDASVPEPLIHRLAQTISDAMGKRLGLVAEYRGPKRNPTLVHHGLVGAATYHVISPGGRPLADLYVVSAADATAIAQAIADATGAPAKLLSNDNLPARLDDHSGVTLGRVRRNPDAAGRPVVGETWRNRAGDNCVVKSVRGIMVEYLDRSNGNRYSSTVNEFVATHKPPVTRRANPSRSKRAQAARRAPRDPGSRGRRVRKAVTRGDKARALYYFEASRGRDRERIRRAPGKYPDAWLKSNPLPAVGSLWYKAEPPAHLARVARIAGGEAELEVVTSSGRVLGTTRVPVGWLGTLYVPELRRNPGGPDDGYYHGGTLATDGMVEMTRAQYAKVHRDHKGKIEGQPTITGRQAGRLGGGTALYFVRFVRGARQNPTPHNIREAVAGLLESAGYPDLVSNVLAGGDPAAALSEAIARRDRDSGLPRSIGKPAAILRRALTMVRGLTPAQLEQPAGRRRTNPRRNPAYAFEGTLRTLEDMPAAVPPLKLVRARRGTRKRATPAAPRAPRAPRAPKPPRLAYGMAVRAPYSGPPSVFGRPVKRTRETGTVVGLEDRNGEPWVHVHVKRGRSYTEQWFPARMVRKRASTVRRGGAQSLDRKHPRLWAALKRETGNDPGRVRKLLDAAVAEQAEVMERAQDLAAGRRTHEGADAFRRAYAVYAKARRRVEMLEMLLREVDPRTAAVEPWDANTPDPWGPEPVAIANPRRRRGHDDELERAKGTFQMWHEFPVDRLERVKVPNKTMPRYLVKLGEVRRIDYDSNKWEGRKVSYTHTTKRPRPVLATDPDARQLYLVGGKMRPTADGLVN